MTDIAPAESPYDIEFFWDPVCPFAWITSRWIAKVAAQTDYAVDWRFISLRLLNKHKDYATEFPAGYEHGHTAGLRMLRVAAAVRADLGRAPLGALVTAYGESYWDKARGSGMREHLSTTAHATEVLEAADLSPSYAAALDDTSWDAELDAETELALDANGPRRRHPDHHVPTAARRVVLRSGDLPDPRRRRGPAALGGRDDAGEVPRLRRDEAQPARGAAADDPRRRPPGGLEGRSPRRPASRRSRRRRLTFASVASRVRRLFGHRFHSGAVSRTTVRIVLAVVVVLAVAGVVAARRISPDDVGGESAVSGTLPVETMSAPLVEAAGWLNSAPLGAAELAGHVVLYDFWTFGCINCRHTQPFVEALQQRYAADGLIILSIHSPEFAYEREPSAVADYVRDNGITYPVALDPQMRTWHNFDNRYWPAFYLHDQQGRRRLTHFGEGRYQETEDAIRRLLGVDPSSPRAAV